MIYRVISLVLSLLPSFTQFYRVVLGFAGFYWVLPSFTRFGRVSLVVIE